MSNYKYSIKDLKPRAHGRWLSILSNAGIEASKTKHTPCPICNRLDTFRVYEKSEHLTYTCTCSYGDGFKLLIDSGTMGFYDALKFVGDYLGGDTSKLKPIKKAQVKASNSDIEKRQKDKKTLLRTLSNTYHTPTKQAKEYYLSRGLSAVPRIESLQYGSQWYMEMPLKNRGGEIPKHPAIVAKLSTFNGEPQGMVRVYIEPKKVLEVLPEGGKMAKKPILKVVDNLNGCGIWLTNSKSPVLHVSEGLENTLSICEALGVYNAVAGNTSGLMGDLIIPSHVSEIHIWADNGDAGISSAEKLRNRYENTIDISIHYPADTGIEVKNKSDWNDILKKYGAKKIIGIIDQSFF